MKSPHFRGLEGPPVAARAWFCRRTMSGLPFDDGRCAAARRAYPLLFAVRRPKCRVKSPNDAALRTNRLISNHRAKTSDARSPHEAVAHSLKCHVGARRRGLIDLAAGRNMRRGFLTLRGSACKHAADLRVCTGPLVGFLAVVAFGYAAFTVAGGRRSARWREPARDCRRCRPDDAAADAARARCCSCRSPWPVVLPALFHRLAPSDVAPVRAWSG